MSHSTDERAPEEKLRLLLEARPLADEQLGEFLRREGIREGDLERWEQEALGGLQRGPSDAGKSRQIRELERRVHKSEKRLKEANALLELQKNEPGRRPTCWNRNSGAILSALSRRRGRWLFGGEDPVKKHGPGSAADLQVVTH